MTGYDGRPGDAVRIEMEKWGDRPHWRFAAVYLGSDEHGDWLGTPAGTHHARPGHAIDSEVDAVTCVPTSTGWLPTFHAPGIWAEVYVDITTHERWDGPVLRAVDLDLDVVRRDSGETAVLDEDEFAEHRVLLGYPDDVVRSAEESCRRVRDAVASRAAPFDAAPERWLTVLAGLSETAGPPAPSGPEGLGR